MSKRIVIEITDTVGADRICDALGVSHHSIRYARNAGSFPARWFGPLSDLCAAAGIDCPKDAFNWVTVAPPSEVA